MVVRLVEELGCWLDIRCFLVQVPLGARDFAPANRPDWAYSMDTGDLSGKEWAG